MKEENEAKASELGNNKENESNPPFIVLFKNIVELVLILYSFNVLLLSKLIHLNNNIIS